MLVSVTQQTVLMFLYISKPSHDKSGYYMKVKVAQLYPALCQPMDCSPPGSVHGILQARILKWLPCPFPEISLIQGSNPNLPHCKQTLYHSSYSGGRLLYDTAQRYDLIFTAFPTLSLSCPWLNYFVTGSLCLLTFLTYFSIPPGQDFLKLNTINRFVHTRAVLAMTDWAMIQPS